MPYYRIAWGNPSSSHRLGRSARVKIAEAREIVAEAVGAEPSEIYFTSGGTESDNLAIKGYAHANEKAGGSHIITSAIEHPAVLETCRYLAGKGFGLSIIDVDSGGVVDVSAVREAMDDKAILITIMTANNEVGSIQPVAEIASIAKEKGVAVHTDAVQGFMKIPVRVDELLVDMLSISGHKINGPKGIGALYLRKGTKTEPLFHGGHHERGIRAGTENVAGIVGFAKAVEVNLKRFDSAAEHVRKLRDALEQGITKVIPDARVNGDPKKRLPGTLNVGFKNVDGEALLISLDMLGVSVSTGAACGSGAAEPSGVLNAMKVPDDYIKGSLRISFGPDNTMEDVEYLMAILPGIVQKARAG